MSININVKELKNLLDSTPHTHNIMLSGKHGIGKSRIITDHFSAKGQKVVTLFLRPFLCLRTGSPRITNPWSSFWMS